MRNPELLSLWLVPTETDVVKVAPVIKSLSERHGTTPFLPHITIYGAINAPLDVTINAAKESVNGVTPFVVEKEKLDYTTEWAKTLFIQIKPNERFNSILSKLRKRLLQYGDYALNPHMSLVYKKEMTEEEKLKEIPNLKIPDSYTIDRIAITVPGDPVEKWENVARWSTPFIQRFNS